MTNRTTEADLKAAYTLDQRDEKIAILSQRCGAADKRVTHLERELVSVSRGMRTPDGIPDRSAELNDAFSFLSARCESDLESVRALLLIRKSLAGFEVGGKLKEESASNAHRAHCALLNKLDELANKLQSMAEQSDRDECRACNGHASDMIRALFSVPHG